MVLFELFRAFDNGLENDRGREYSTTYIVAGPEDTTEEEIKAAIMQPISYLMVDDGCIFDVGIRRAPVVAAELPEEVQRAINGVKDSQATQRVNEKFVVVWVNRLSPKDSFKGVKFL